MKLYKLYIIGYLLSGFFGLSLSAQRIDLGTLTATNITTTSEPLPDTHPIESAFDGIWQTAEDAWIGTRNNDEFVSWDINPFENTIVDTNTYKSILFTIEIYTGSVSTTLNRFSLRFAADGDAFSSYVTEFGTLFSVNIFDGGLLEIGTFEENPSIIILREDALVNNYAKHTISFQAPPTTSKLQLVTRAGSNPAFSVEEIVVSALAVPEPSTYALLLGLGCFGFRMIPRKKIESDSIY